MDDGSDAKPAVAGLSKAIQHALETFEPILRDADSQHTYHRNAQRYVLWTVDHRAVEGSLDILLKNEPEMQHAIASLLISLGQFILNIFSPARIVDENRPGPSSVELPDDPERPELKQLSLRRSQQRWLYNMERGKVMALEWVAWYLAKALRSWPDCQDLVIDAEVLEENYGPTSRPVSSPPQKGKIPLILPDEEFEEDLMGVEVTIDQLYDLVPSLQWIRSPSPASDLASQQSINIYTGTAELYDQICCTFPELPTQLAHVLSKAYRRDRTILQREEELEDKDAITDDYVELPPGFPEYPGANHENGTEVICAVCHRHVTIATRSQWRRHILQDLRPYVCIHPECNVRPPTFASFSCFQRHTIGHYTIQKWYCRLGCEIRFDAEAQLADHLHTTHEIVESQSCVDIANLWQESEFVENNEDACPFCCASVSEDHEEYVQHIGQHMVEISLWSSESTIEDLEAPARMASKSSGQQDAIPKSPVSDTKSLLEDLGLNLFHAVKQDFHPESASRNDIPPSQHDRARIQERQGASVGLPSISTQPRTVAEIKPMSWEEYVQNKGAPTPSVHYAIELLMEDPVIRDVRDHSMPPRPKKGRIQSKRDKRGKGASNPRDTSTSGDPEMKQLPERIRIHSSYLKQLLASVSGGQLSQPPDAPLVMRRPFKFLLYEEETLRQHVSELEETVSELGDQSEAGETSSADELNLSCLLLEFLDLYVKPTQQQVIQKQSVYFHELWFLYQPGQLLYSRAKNYPQRVWKVVQVTGGNRFLRRYEPDDDSIEYKHSKTDTFGPLSLDCFFLAFDGVGFQPAYRGLEIPHFHGLRDMSDLQVIPLEVAEIRELINKEDLLLPGKRYLECLDGSYMFYRGWTVDKDSLGTQLVFAESHPILPENIESEVMIDLRRAFRLNPQWIPELAILPEHQANPREFEGHYTWKSEPIAEDIHWDILRREDIVETMNHQGKDHAWARCEISGEDLFLLPARAPAFVFSSRSWSYLHLDFDEKGSGLRNELTKVEPNSRPWDELALPHGHKVMIQALVRSYFDIDEGMNLLRARDKGQGLVILLHGIPGVGKTSTAECVASDLGKPLLSITPGDLGLDPVQAEANMLRYFDLAQAWDCILLLDEADVFLASRTASDLQRNALVSVFLRLLEYYRGVLFMTTNRVGSIDEAFKSRIQMSLYYAPLTSDQTMQIWKNQIRKARQIFRGVIRDEEVLLKAAHQIWKDQGSSKRWNGRQIHNAFAAAISLARFKKKPLVPEHLRTVADASAVLDEYLLKVHSSSDSQIMRRQMIRADDFEPGRLTPMPEEYSTRHYDPHMMPGVSSLPRMSAQRAQAGDPDASSSPLTGDDTYNNQYPHEHRELPVATSSQRMHAQRARMEDFNPGGYPPIRDDSHYSQYRHEQASSQHQPFFPRPPSGQFHPSQFMITPGQHQPSYSTATPGHPTSAAPDPSYYIQQPYQNTHRTPQQHPVHTAQPAPMYGWSTAGPRMPPSPQSQPPTTVTSSMPTQNINTY